MAEVQERRFTFWDGFRSATHGTRGKLRILLGILTAFSLVQRVCDFGLYRVFKVVVDAYRLASDRIFGFLLQWVDFTIPALWQDLTILWLMISAAIFSPRATLEDAILSYKYYMELPSSNKWYHTWRMINAWFWVILSVVFWPWALTKVMAKKNSYDGWLFGTSRGEQVGRLTDCILFLLIGHILGNSYFSVNKRLFVQFVSITNMFHSNGKCES